MVASTAGDTGQTLQPSTVSAVVGGTIDSHAANHRRKEHHQQSHHHHNNNNTTSHSRNYRSRQGQGNSRMREPRAPTGNYMEDYACCYDLYQNALSPLDERPRQRSPTTRCLISVYRCMSRVCSWIRRYIRRLVEHKYFQQGILLAILINTLSMGIEYHNQPPELTAIVETSNVVFSGIFAVEMLLKVVAEGPFRYIANGFNVFDGIIVILR